VRNRAYVRDDVDSKLLSKVVEQGKIKVIQEEKRNADVVILASFFMGL